MRWFARLKTNSVPYTLWKRKGIGPYTLMNVPFKWEPSSLSFVTGELNSSEIDRMLTLPEVQMEVIQDVTLPSSLYISVVAPVEEKSEEKPVEESTTKESTTKESSGVEDSKPKSVEPRKARSVSK